jgi:hypothetical protein
VGRQDAARTAGSPPKSDFMPLVAERIKADLAVTGELLPLALNSSRDMTVPASDEKSMGSVEPIAPTVIVFRSEPGNMAHTKRAAAAAKAQQIRFRE